MQRICAIMPVASDPEYQAKRSTIEAVSSDCGYSVLFPLDAGPRFSLDEMLANLSECDLVIADVTNERPSCYYELGLAEGMRKPVFVFATRGTQIHQLAKPESVIYYDQLDVFRELLAETLANQCRESC